MEQVANYRLIVKERKRTLLLVNLTRRSFVYLSLAILAAGYMGGETSVVLPTLVERLGISPTQAGTLISVRFFGGVASGIILLLLGDRYSFRRLFTIAALIVITSALLLPFATTYPTVLAVSAVRGPALTILIATSNGALASWFRRHPGKWASRIHSLYGLGLILAPLVGFLISRVNLSWAFVWTIPAFILLPMLYLTMRLPTGRTPRGYVPCNECDDSDNAISIGQWLLIMLFAGVTVGTEATIIGWTPTYTALLPERILPPELFSLMIAVGILVGRRITSRISVHAGSARTHEVSIFAIFVLGAVMVSPIGGRLVAAALLGFAMSAMYPLLAARLGIFALRSNGRLYPTVELAAAGGGTLFPFLVGYASEYSVEYAFPGMLLVSTVLLATLSLWLRRTAAR